MGGGVKVRRVVVVAVVVRGGDETLGVWGWRRCVRRRGGRDGR